MSRIYSRNVNSVTISDVHRINNISEAGNNDILAVIGSVHPNIWKYIYRRKLVMVVLRSKSLPDNEEIVTYIDHL